MDDTYDQIAEQIEDERPGTRPGNTYASTLTSVDTKLAYNHDEDRFEAFIIGDINANPEGIVPLSDGVDVMYMDGVGDVYEDTTLADVVAGGYLHNANEEADGTGLDVAAVMHPATYDGDWGDEKNWLVADKKRITDALEANDAVDQVYPVLPGDLDVDGYDIAVNGTDVDGYVNVYDRGEQLLGDFVEDDTDLDDALYAMAKGSNAATAVWNERDVVRPWTDKTGTLDAASDIADYLDDVHTAGHDRIYHLEDALEFQRNGDPVIVKAALGTWGDSVVPIDPDASYDEALDTIRAEEKRVQAVDNRPDDFHILDGDGYFVAPSIGDKTANSAVSDVETYGLVEEAIAGTIERGGDAYTVFDYEGQPVDFVPLATYDPVSGQAEVHGVTVRTAGKTHLNANRGGKNFAVQEIDEAFHDAVVPADFKHLDVQYNLQEELEELAGREVTYDEIRGPLEDAGTVAFAARNIAAFNAEEQLAEYGDR